MLNHMRYAHTVWLMDTFFTHAKNSSGGCTVKIYTCQRCEKCGYLANKKYNNTITYAKCPHNNKIIMIIIIIPII